MLRLEQMGTQKYPTSTSVRSKTNGTSGRKKKLLPTWKTFLNGHPNRGNQASFCSSDFPTKKYHWRHDLTSYFSEFPDVSERSKPLALALTFKLTWNEVRQRSYGALQLSGRCRVLRNVLPIPLVEPGQFLGVQFRHCTKLLNQNMYWYIILPQLKSASCDEKHRK